MVCGGQIGGVFFMYSLGALESGENAKNCVNGGARIEYMEDTPGGNISLHLELS